MLPLLMVVVVVAIVAVIPVVAPSDFVSVEGRISRVANDDGQRVSLIGSSV